MSASLHDLIEIGAERNAAHPYLEDARSARIITFGELAAITRAWYSTCAASGIHDDATVVLDIADPLDFATSYLAIIASGRCAIPLDPAMPDAEFSRATRLLQPDLVISDKPTRAAIARHAPPPMAALTTATANGPGRIRLRTSGSTGEPKVVELTEAHLLHVAHAVASHNRLTEDDRGYNPLPLFHINAEVVALLATLVSGATLVLDRRFHRDGFWTLIEERQISWINAVPAILTILSRDPIPPRPSALRLVRSASAPLPRPVRTILTDALGEVVVESYGMTEAASQITATEPGVTPPPGSAGRASGAQLQVRTPAGELARRGEVGQIWIRGPGVITDYVGGRAAARFDADGWLDTLDLGSVDERGYLFLAGRADDVINRGGQLVYPREIEEVLLSDPDVLDAVVVGRPDEVLGAVAVGYVVARERQPRHGLLSDLEDRCREQLSKYKRPVALELVDDLPRAPTGKIRRHEVREAALSGWRP